MPVKTLTEPSELGEHTTIVKFFATWCGPCKAFAPIFEQASNKDENADLDFAEADIEQLPELAEVAGVQTVPAIRAFRGGQQVASLDWPINPKNFKEFVATIRS